MLLPGQPFCSTVEGPAFHLHAVMDPVVGGPSSVDKETEVNPSHLGHLETLWLRRLNSGPELVVSGVSWSNGTGCEWCLRIRLVKRQIQVQHLQLVGWNLSDALGGPQCGLGLGAACSRGVTRQQARQEEGRWRGPAKGLPEPPRPFSQSVLYPRSLSQSQALRSSKAWEIVGGWPEIPRLLAFSQATLAKQLEQARWRLLFLRLRQLRASPSATRAGRLP